MTVESHGIDWKPDHTVKDTNNWIDNEFLGTPFQKLRYRMEVFAKKVAKEKLHLNLNGDSSRKV